MLSTHAVNTLNMWQIGRISISLAFAHTPVNERTTPTTSVHTYICMPVQEKPGVIVSVSDLPLHSTWPTINGPGELRISHVHAHHQVQQYNIKF